MTAIDKSVMKEAIKEFLLENPSLVKQALKEYIDQAEESPEQRTMRIKQLIQADFDEFEDTFKALA